MASSRYQYETSPRKLEPERKVKTNKKKNLKVVKNVPQQEIKISKEQKMKQIKLTAIVVAIFGLLLTVSYRNAQINVKFNEKQELETELATLQKENEQLEVSIENSLNLSTIEQVAKEQLGMQKLTSKQIVYVTLSNQDFTESASEKVSVSNEDGNLFEQIINKIFNW